MSYSEVLLNQVTNDIRELKIKMSMPDDTIQIRNSLFYLPNYPADLIQHAIVTQQNYWEHISLAKIDKYLQEKAVIVDIGANIGNNSLYWAVERNAKKIYAFEPIESTYKILERNIHINNLEDVIQPYMLGLSDEETYAKINRYNIYNIGGTALDKAKDGKIKLVPLDSIDIKEKIDFIKIDAEDSEIDVLVGAAKTIVKHKPLIVLEAFPKHKTLINAILEELKYTQVEELTEADFIYKYIG